MALEIDGTLKGINDHFNHTETVLTAISEHYVSPPSDISIPLVDTGNVHLSAYYLPQFHRLKVNDDAWGSGFTEWTNVTRAHPYFPGHVQPHLPSDLGLYDLENSETLKHQIQLARHYGISSFCFYYYWFGGMKIMDKPLAQLLNDKTLNIQFSLCWANENWTRRWDGMDHEIILQQPHSFEHDKRFIYDILPYLLDPRYVRVSGAALIILYRPSLMGPHLEATIDHWRKTASDAGAGPLLILGSTSGINFSTQEINLRNLDGLAQFPPHGHWSYSLRYNLNGFFNKRFTGSLGDYDHAVNFLMDQHNYDTPLIPGVFPSWDNTARKRFFSRIYVNSNPLKYQQWLERAISLAKDSSFVKNLVFINAWNEWAEGAHLEPCRWYGHAHLAATRRALLNLQKSITT
ncbi:MAG: glycoside hydrolase family 99-like domain-containing protein [Porticoccaceae bacterium]